MASALPARELLRAIWLFSELDERELDDLARMAVRRRLPADSVVVRQGDPDADLYAIAEGLVRVSLRASDGREIVLNLLRRGDVFGEITLLDGLSRSATVTTVQRCDLLVIRRADFLELIRRSPQLGINLLRSMAASVRRLTERTEDLSLSVRARLAKKLLEIADICGTRLSPTQVALPAALSQQDLANHVQATRESVNKCLTSWSRAGIIQRSSSQIVIHDRERLLAMTREPT